MPMQGCSIPGGGRMVENHPDTFTDREVKAFVEQMLNQLGRR